MTLVELLSARFAKASLKNKFFLSMLAVVLLVSASTGLAARWILIGSMTNELVLRGTAIAHSVAERGAEYILENDRPELLALIYDEAVLRERKYLVTYIFVTDDENHVLAHTLTRRLPQELVRANPLPSPKQTSVLQLSLGAEEVYDIAVPITEGLHRIGTARVGLSKAHMDGLIAKLRLAFLAFITAIVLILLAISNRLSKHITRSLTALTRISDELSRGNFEIRMPEDMANGVTPDDCPAFADTNLPCWHFDLSDDAAESGHIRLRGCTDCRFYHSSDGDEVSQLAASFRNMVWSIRLYRRRLRESEEKYRSLFDSGPEPVFVIDRGNFRIIDANPRAEALYGYSRRELLGKPFLKLGPEHAARFLDEFRGPGPLPNFVSRPRVMHFDKENKPFYVNLHASPIIYLGRPAVIVAVTDITEMVDKDAQLIQAGKMSAGIAHEINQPLNAIKMGSEFLALLGERGERPDPEHYAEVVREISGQCDRAAEIITTLRSFGRKAPNIDERVDVNHPVRRVLTLVRRQFELENIRFRLELAESPPPIVARDNRLQQVFFNLVTNARDAIVERGAPGERQITIRTYAENGTVVAEVEDTGTGIPESMHESVFEPFFTTKEAGQGMGLGLAITYGIVRDHDGEIAIESEQGRGTTFRLTFPAAE